MACGERQWILWVKTVEFEIPVVYPGLGIQKATGNVKKSGMEVEIWELLILIQGYIFLKISNAYYRWYSKEFNCIRHWTTWNYFFFNLFNFLLIFLVAKLSQFGAIMLKHLSKACWSAFIFLFFLLFKKFIYLFFLVISTPNMGLELVTPRSRVSHATN